MPAMPAPPLPRSESQPPGLLARLFYLGLLLVPAVLLTVGVFRVSGFTQNVLWLGIVFQLLGCVLVLVAQRGAGSLVSTPVIVLYVIGLSWLLLAAQGMGDWYFHLAQAVLLLVPLAFFGWQCLRDSGALVLRRARMLCDRLSRRLEWPADLAACRTLPEVKALREALQVDASPALHLLGHPRLEVRIAALAALEYRHNWLPGQPEMLLHLAQHTTEPEIKVGVIQALANIEERQLIEPLAEFLADPSAKVRAAAVESLLWNTEQRWSWLRGAVRLALAHSNAQQDGPLFQSGPLLTADAIGDLTAWTAEKGILGIRAALTLGVHYSQVLARESDPELIQDLRRQLNDVHAPAMLRLELAKILHQHRELDESCLRRLLDPSSPAPLRLIAVETLLAQGDSTEAVAALRELARLPNREIALATADVVQRRLGKPMGLPRGQPLPPVQSKLAADVARHVLAWATTAEGDFDDDLEAPPEMRGPRTFSEI